MDGAPLVVKRGAEVHRRLRGVWDLDDAVGAVGALEAIVVIKPARADAVSGAFLGGCRYIPDSRPGGGGRGGVRGILGKRRTPAPAPSPCCHV